MIREFQPTQEDFNAFIQLFYHTDFSFELDTQSNKERGCNLRFIPNYSVYCTMVSDPSVYNYLAYIDENNRIIGGVEFTIIATTVTILHFVILPDMQLKGHGRRFYGEFQGYLKNHDILTINLHSFAFGSINFWNKMGFKEKYISFYKFLK